jgi:RNA polymerase sigma-54 factor
MLLQLRYLRDEGHDHPVAESMIRDRFEDVANGRVTRLARACDVSVDKARSAVEFIRAHLHPYPASRFHPPWAVRGATHRSAIRPDVVIRRTELGYEVEVVGTEPFLLGVNPRYREAYDSIRTGNGAVREADKRHVTEYVERAELFIRNIKQRRRTLRSITRCIIDFQQGFLETGSKSYLRPLTRTRIAEELGMHESTVSRATSEKYVQLPNQEVVPFDIFFNPSLSVRTAIEEIISGEDPGRPLSDQCIVDLLRRKGYKVARRTVVKYRDAQKILASNRRRR